MDPTTSTTPPRRAGARARRRRALATVLLSLGWCLLLVTTTARVTLLDSDFHREVLSETNAYERLYSEVLPSPAVQRLLTTQLSVLPLDATYITANLRLLLPPRVLEDVTDQALAHYVDYLLGRGDPLTAQVVARPLLRHLVALAADLAPGTVATTRPLTVRDLQQFALTFRQVLDGLARGDRDVQLPTLPVPPALAAGVTEALLTGLPLKVQDNLHQRLSGLLAIGDLTGALTLAVREQLTADPRLLDTVTRELTSTLNQPLGASGALRGAASGPRLLPLGVTVGPLLGGALMLLGAAGLLRSTRRPSRAVAGGLACAAAAALVAGAAAGQLLHDPLRTVSDAASGLPPSVQRLAADLDTQLRHDVTRTYLLLDGMLLLLAVTALLLRRQPGRRRGRVEHRAVGLTAGLLTVAVTVLVVTPDTPAVTTCDGSRVLCDRSYDQVSYLTSHNAMANSDAGFLIAHQDLDITAQLDQGARALMLDLHRWDTPEPVAAYLAQLPGPARQTLLNLARDLDTRPGLWLCHIACQLGATPAVAGLRSIGRWLDAHPDTVLTLIVEDHVTRGELTDLLHDSHLDRLLATPPTGSAPWPTLGSMIRTGKRLVVFTEKDRPDHGKVRNLYDYAAETPYAARTVPELTCRPGRGPATAPLFLLNNWISTAAPSHAQALTVNRATALARRIQTCQATRGMRPTFVAVDFSTIGDPLTVVSRLNGTS